MKTYEISSLKVRKWMVTRSDRQADYIRDLRKV